MPRSSTRQFSPRPNLPKSVPTPPRTRPHIRARKSRRAWWKLLGWTVLSGLVLAGLLRAYWEANPYIKAWLEIREVTIVGAVQVTHKDVLSRLALPPRATQLSIDTDRLASKLRSHSWVRDVAVARRLPHGLEVQLKERRPAAYLQNGSTLLLLDDEGHVLSVSLLQESAENASLPVLIGIQPDALMHGEGTARAAVKSAVEVAALVETVFPFSVQPVAEGQGRRGKLQVDVTDLENVVAHVNGLRFQFGASGFEEKWSRYRRVGSDLQLTAASVGHGRSDARAEKSLQAQEIDLRYQDKVIVRERG
jgi:hypothetical protein